MSKNEHTGDKMQTKPATDDYRNNFDRIFGKSKVPLTGCGNEQCFCTGECKKPLDKRLEE